MNSWAFKRILAATIALPVVSGELGQGQATISDAPTRHSKANTPSALLLTLHLVFRTVNHLLGLASRFSTVKATSHSAITEATVCGQQGRPISRR